jgi:hypothetical protein
MGKKKIKQKRMRKRKRKRKKNCSHLVVKRPNPNGKEARRPRNARDSSAFKSTFFPPLRKVLRKLRAKNKFVMFVFIV